MFHKIGKFQILTRLGLGGMGSVYLALDTVLNRRVALKLIHPASADGEEARRRFRREAQTAAQLRHPNLVTIFEFGEEEEGLFLVMEYLEGVDLETALKEGLLSDHQAVGVLAQICDGLAYAHDRGIVHRDIKPSNVRLHLENDQLGSKVLDFGIARLRHDALLTGSGMIVGTPCYTAPEVLRGGEPDPRMDLWSVGVVLYEVLTGHRPFEASTPAGIHFKIAFEPMPEIEFSAPTELRRGMEIIVRRSLSKNPEDRFTSALELAKAFRSLPEFDPDQARIPLAFKSLPFRSEDASTLPMERTPPTKPAREENAFREQRPLSSIAPSPMVLLREAAESGDADAANALGLRFLMGEGFVRDSVEAARWFRKAAEIGQPAAAYNLGCLYDLGDGVPLDTSEAVRLYRIASEGGLLEGMVALGRVLLQASPDLPNEALGWLRKAAEGGAPEGIWLLSKTLLNSPASAEAGAWLEKAAELRIPDAMAELGRTMADPDQALIWFGRAEALGFQDASLEAGLRCIEIGRSEEAAQWFRKASWKGSVEAMYRLALMEIAGDGVAVNLREAMSYLRKAGEQGHQEATFLRAKMMLSGESGSSDASTALDLMSNLSRAGHTGAQLELARHLSSGDRITPDRGRALELFKAAAEAGSAEAAYEAWIALELESPSLALRYLQQAARADLAEAMGALGVHLSSASPVDAIPWLKKGAEAGHVEAMVKFAEAHYSGIGIRENKLEALRWFRSAAKAGNKQAASRAARMLGKGDGVLANKEEARKWAEVAGSKGLMGGILSRFNFKS